jgi:predicted phosphodiesterase
VSSDSCQRLVADRMAQEMNRLGDVKFVINVGDSFYPGGVTSKSDRRWDDVWRKVYSRELRALPWYSIYGNHDLHMDRGICSWDDRQGAQINADFNNRNFFYMPSTSYFAEIPELNSEIIAVDQNYEWQGELCKWVPDDCKRNCPSILKGRNDRGFQLFHDRVANSQAKNLIVVTHYPTDFCHQHQGCERFKDVLRKNAKGNLAYFTGHTHVTQPMQVRDPSVFQNPGNFWLSGGGGGWSTEGDQGFVVGQIGLDGNLTTYPVLINSQACLR